jgi:hypothetical protein
MRKWQHRINDSVAQGKLPRFIDRLLPHRRKYARELHELSGLLCYTVPAVDPPSLLKERLLASLDSREYTVVPESARRWRFLLPGIEVCMLSRSAGHRSVLLRIKAGYALPAHSHRRIEQAMVLEGSCLSGTIPLKKGDFFLAAAGTRHEPVRAIEDCVILVIAHK